MLFAPKFVTQEHYINSRGQGLPDLVTLRYAIASLIQALVIISDHLREMTGFEFKYMICVDMP